MTIHNPLVINLVTSGIDPSTNCILQLTAWPRVPPPFGDKAFTTLIQPYKEVDKYSLDKDFLWALDNYSPIYREANTVYGAWLDFHNYLTDVYRTKPIEIKRVFDTCFYTYNWLQSDAAEFLKGLYLEFLKTTGNSETKYKWPFND